MKKILTTLGLITCISSYCANIPTLGTITNDKINIGTKDNYIIVGNITDGDIGIIQNITVTAISSNNSILSVTSVNYTQGQTFAIVKVKEFGTAGFATIGFTAKDINGSTTKNFNVNVGDFYKKGNISSVYDFPFWTCNIPSLNEFSQLDSLLPASENTLLDGENGVYKNLSLANAFTMQSMYGVGIINRLKGYFTPTATGFYLFEGITQQGVQFDLYNSDEISSNNIYKTFKKTINFDNTQNKISFLVTLTGGQTYGYMAANYNFDVRYFAIKYAYLGSIEPSVTFRNGNGFFNTPTVVGATMQLMQNNQITPYNDIDRPTIVGMLQQDRKSKNSVSLVWNKALDPNPETNSGLDGYNIYVDGVMFKHLKNPTDTSFILKNLTSNTDYSIFITAIDKNGNESLPSNTIQTKTYDLETTPPNPPTILNVVELGDISVKVSWSGASDNASGIYGYRIFVDNILYNSDTLNSNSIVLKSYYPQTTHSFKVQAIDGNFNASAFSASTNFTTSAYNPLATSPGVKKISVNIEKEFIGKIDGFGINMGADDYSQSRIDEAKKLNTGLVRWGGLDKNSISYNSASNGSKTYAKFINFANKADAAASISIGTDATPLIDWRDESNTNVMFGNTSVQMKVMERTAQQMIAYLFAPDSMATKNVAGAEFFPFHADVQKRLNEGFRQSTFTGFNSVFKGLIIEFGSEPWGGTTNGTISLDFNADGFDDYIVYGQWCRTLAKAFKNSPYFDSTKVRLAYSGREPQPSNSFNLTQNLLTGNDDDKVDMITLGGYLEGIPNYSNTMSKDEAEKQYYKKSVENVFKNIKGMYETMDLDFSLRKKQRPFYFYETAFTSNNYTQRFGQAVVLTDYLLTSHKAGAYYPSIFSLDIANQWSILNNNVPNPMYHFAQIINNITKGNRDILKTNNITNQRLRNSLGEIISASGEFLEPVSTNIYHKNGVYSLILINRDFDDDYQIQLNFPLGMLPTASVSGRFFTITTSGNFSSNLSTILGTSASLFDKMLVNVPKHGMVVFTFLGEILKENYQKLGYTSYNSPTLISTKLTIPSNPNGNVLSLQNGSIFVNTTISGGRNNMTTVGWNIVKSSNNMIFDSFYTDNSLQITATSCLSNGILTITNFSLNNPNLKNTNIITITGQIVCLPNLTQTITGMFSNQSINLSSNSLVFNVSASSGLTVTLQSNNISIANFVGNTLNLLNTGVVTISASQIGNNNYLPAKTVFTILTITGGSNLTPQTINISPITNKTTNDSPFNIQGSASSGLVVSYQILSGPASVSGNQITLNGTPGTVSVRATQSGNSTYSPASSVDFSFNVISPTLLNQTISYTSIPSKTTNDLPFNIQGSASSGLVVSYQILSGPANVSGNQITLNGTPGTVSVRATQLGNSIYAPASSVDFSFNVISPTLLNQTISFPDITSKSTSDAPFILNATASSGLNVVFTLIQGPANLSGNTITLNGNSGIIIVRATQSGNSIYNPASVVDKFILVNNASLLNQNITFPAIPDQISGSGSITLGATASSNLQVDYEVVSGPASIFGNNLILTSGFGDVTIRASQSGNSFYNPAQYIDRIFNVCQNIGANTVTISNTGSLSFCLPQNITLTSSINNPTMKWSNGSTNPSIVVQNSGTYTLTVGSGLCKVVSNSLQATAKNPIITPICMVTVDESTGKNKVIFEKPSGFVTSITSWKIYRESSVANQFLLQSNLTLSNLSEYVDMTANPQNQAFRYKLETRDNICNTDNQSAAHKTMHLTINKGQNASTWNLIWTPYEGIPLATHRIYRGTTATNLTFIADVAGSLSSYTDADAPAVNTIYYVIELITGQTCTPTARTESYTTIRSNVAEASTTSSSSKQILSNKVNIYPNPNNGTFTVETSELMTKDNIKICDLLGKMQPFELVNNEITISKSGLYFVHIGNKVTKVVVE